jgi:RHS repeat-associated protein
MVVPFVAADTVYANSNGTGARTTSYAYTWAGSSPQVQSETETDPVSASASDVTTTVYNALGQPVWVKDPDGYIDYAAYDPATGAQVLSIQDVNTADTGEFTGLPAGWSTPAGGGLNLVTSYVVDALGRTTEETSPAGNVTYTVYLDAQHEERVYPGWNAATGTPTGPTEVYRQDAADGYDEAFTMTAAPHLSNGVPDGTEAVSGLQSLQRDYTDASGQVTAADAYFNLAGLAYTTGVMGAAGANFDQTLYGYDAGGNLSRTQTANGTIYRTVYDAEGRPVSDWVGTDDTPASGTWSPSNNTGPSNMVEVSSYQYDGGGVGDGNLTQQTDYPGGGAAARVTENWYDWRDRLVATKAGVQSGENDGTNRPLTYTTYDNLDEVVETQVYDGDGVTLTTANGVPQPPAANLLRAQETDAYDQQGELTQSQVYDVNPSTGAVSASALTTGYYYDHRGDLVAESDPGGLWTKSVYDGAGRDVTDYTTDGAGGAANAGNVTSDTVLGQMQTVYDGDGNAIETLDSQRFDNATGTGPLGTPTTGVAARVYYSAAYYDAADRPTADVDVGTNGGEAWVRPSAPPARSATALVTTYGYNAAGGVQDVTDPLGVDTRTLYDALGRTTETIDNYTGNAETASSDVATQYAYDGDGNLLSVTADEPGGAYQQTAYVYGVSTATGSAVNSNDVLAAVQHPDPSTGNASATQQESYQVNALGQVTQYTDRNGSVHQYTYDVLGRQTSDAVTTLGAGVDGAVRRVDTAYDSQGNAYLLTSYDAPSGGNVVNQVQNAYNGLGQLTAQYQAVRGAVNTATTPAVLYSYAELSGGQNNSRPTGMTYPSGYALSYNYNPGLDNNISRLSSISDSGGVLESYRYLGLDTVVERDHPQTNVNLTYISQTGQTGDAGDRYTGLDRFGRVVEQNWYDAATGTSTDDFLYGYDADGDVLYRQNAVDAAFSELYQYDGLNQLTGYQRGTLNAGRTGLAGSPSDSQSWNLDALGNFNAVTTNGTQQTRTANQQNEITSISGAGAVSYDANGNLTADGSGNTYTYDAWNRLVSVSSGGTAVATYTYNGLGERVSETRGATTTDLYYDASWQVIEERVAGVTQARNVWSAAGTDVLVLRDQSSQHNGVLDQRLYVQQDANGDVTAITDASGNVVERYAYEPYGAAQVLTASWQALAASEYGWAYLFQGKRYDAAAGLYDSRARAYSPSLGRFLQDDPLGFAAGQDNLYQYVGDDPCNDTDPFGRDVYVVTGASGNILNRQFHQDIVVDTWEKRSGKWVKTGQAHYTFAAAYPLPRISSTWLGKSSITCTVLTGKVYKYTPSRTGTVSKTLKTTPQFDQKFEETLDESIRMTGGYSLLRHNCRTFSQDMFKKAQEQFDEE